MFDLTDKTILITGSCKGIGLAMAKALHHQGAHVAVTARETDNYPDLMQHFVSDPERVLLLNCDIASETSIQRTVQSVVNWRGQINGCIANAGERGSGTPVTELSVDRWQQNINTNLNGTFLTLKYAAQAMKQQNVGGRLAATASVAALKGNAGFADYGASKAAITALSRSLAVELAADRITVNCILPGWVETDMNADVLADRRQYESIKRLRIPMGYWAKPEDIAPAAVYLMSAESGYQTGDALTIDGGYSIF
ncbi:SDR family NAD(P)-dependent oxidoreductase [Veronia pacifica]|uniref:Ketoreductase domain-containing protein n=1 Tax=Veronia pacifica TaxID=1080227 RepID=A0A1C3EIN2_9GAMM|nr:SDR family NAD(P)-dependent oxidoreductase [Veronia pacifica]ODA33069.1 hypothetical protein A8L45_11530 [Veronia pacifica]